MADEAELEGWRVERGDNPVGESKSIGLDRVRSGYREQRINREEEREKQKKEKEGKEEKSSGLDGLGWDCRVGYAILTILTIPVIYFIIFYFTF